MKERKPTDYVTAARALHCRALVVDTHCDATLRLSQPGWDFGRRHDIGHVDIPRLREGGVDALFLAVWAPKPRGPGEGIREARQQLDVIRQTVQRFPDDLMFARTAADIERAHQAGRIAILVGIEGGYFIEESLDALHEFHATGATYLTLTHAWHTDWADSSGVHEPLEPRHHGLTDFGREVICEMNRLGMMVDLSHASDETFWQAVELSKAPVILTHSSCRAVNPHRRNVTDEMMRAVADVGGVVQINFSATFVDTDFPSFTPRPFEDIAKEAWIRDPAPDHTTPLGKLADHFEHAISLIGPEHVGIGSDFDGTGHLPAGLEDCSRLPNLTAELLRRGIREDDLIKILGQNVLRVMRECAQVAEGLVSTRAKQ